MGAGAQPDRDPDHRVDARGRGRKLALRGHLGAVAVSMTLLAALPAPATPAPGTAYEWHLPRGFPTPFVPAGNPMSATKVALGKRLFFETRLSASGRYSCASCHDPARSFTDGHALAVGGAGAVMTRSAMALVNVAYNLAYGWQHPQVTSLEAQLQLPLLNRQPVEIGLA